MQLKPGFILREVCGQKVIVAEGLGAVDFGKLLSLNDTAAFLWQKAQEGDFTAEGLAEAMCQQFDIDQATAFADVKEIIDKWQQLGLIQ
ncbi:MAG: PqqD family protein [Bacteroidales bacterium]|nr:PqqD family protein [Bacteroidales bacterium]